MKLDVDEINLRALCKWLFHHSRWCPGTSCNPVSMAIRNGLGKNWRRSVYLPYHQSLLEKIVIKLSVTEILYSLTFLPVIDVEWSKYLIFPS